MAKRKRYFINSDGLKHLVVKQCEDQTFCTFADCRWPDDARLICDALNAWDEKATLDDARRQMLGDGRPSDWRSGKSS